MPTQLSYDRQHSTEYFGQGQSGYTAGRVECDHALELEIEARNVGYPPGAEEHPDDLGTDERFVGLGSTPWIPEEPDAAQQVTQPRTGVPLAPPRS
jgi:hypothetical protein